MTSLSARIYEIVRNIPRGEVMTYGQIAEMLGDKRLARAVGNALHKNPDRENIPCHRVVNFKGELSKSFAFGGIEAQRRLLESEGVEVVGDKVVKASRHCELRSSYLRKVCRSYGAWEDAGIPS